LKIVQFIPHLRNGGAERLVIDLCNVLSERNEVIICTLRATDKTMFYTQEINKKVRLVTFGKKKGLHIKLPFQIYQLLKSENPDIVNTHLPSVFPYLLVSILFLRKISFFHTIHTVPMVEESRWWMRKIRQLLINSGLLSLIAISDEIGARTSELYNRPVAAVIKNGRSEISASINLEKVKKEVNSLKINENDVVFTSVGRLSQEKNHGLIISVFRRLKELKINAILLIIGEDYGTGRKVEYERKKAPNTFLLGPKSNICDYLLMSDCFCLSSFYEGLPISLLEAMNAGLPVISTAVGGIPDVIKDGINGFLCQPNEEDYLDAVMKFITSDSIIIERMKQNNRNLFREIFSIKITAENYFAIYRKAREAVKN
jgi:glycosyltransferase involved in cell wall biosynthesis